MHAYIHVNIRVAEENTKKRRVIAKTIAFKFTIYLKRKTVIVVRF